MKTVISAFKATAILAVWTTVLATSISVARAEPEAAKLADAVSLFQNAGQSGAFFQHSYGYAVIPTVGEGAFVVGGAGGKGGVFVHGQQVGEVKLGQLSVGFQAGGKAFSEIVFFEDKRAFNEFTSGHFEFGADASVTAITANVDASAGTTGENSGASGGEKDARTQGHYYKGMAVFTIAKGGLMYQAAVAGQKFSYKPFSAS
jgi:lipid-binding SYLF domain-containing protein